MKAEREPEAQEANRREPEAQDAKKLSSDSAPSLDEPPQYEARKVKIHIFTG